MFKVFFLIWFCGRCNTGEALVDGRLPIADCSRRHRTGIHIDYLGTRYIVYVVLLFRTLLYASKNYRE